MPVTMLHEGCPKALIRNHVSQCNPLDVAAAPIAPGAGAAAGGAAEDQGYQVGARLPATAAASWRVRLILHRLYSAWSAASWQPACVGAAPATAAAPGWCRRPVHCNAFIKCELAHSELALLHVQSMDTPTPYPGHLGPLRHRSTASQTVLAHELMQRQSLRKTETKLVTCITPSCPWIWRV